MAQGLDLAALDDEGILQRLLDIEDRRRRHLAGEGREPVRRRLLRQRAVEIFLDKVAVGEAVLEGAEAWVVAPFRTADRVAQHAPELDRKSTRLNSSH